MNKERIDFCQEHESKKCEEFDMNEKFIPLSEHKEIVKKLKDNCGCDMSNIWYDEGKKQMKYEIEEVQQEERQRVIEEKLKIIKVIREAELNKDKFSVLNRLAGIEEELLNQKKMEEQKE